MRDTVKPQWIMQGEFERYHWYNVSGLSDPLFKKWLDRVKELDWTGYELWVYGGLLEPWYTWDIDCTVMGPYNPDRIRELLYGITRVGFNIGLRSDVKWGRELFDWQEYKLTNQTKYIEYAYYSGSIWADGRQSNYAILNSDGLWMGGREWPIQKTLNKHHNYKSPLRLI